MKKIEIIENFFKDYEFDDDSVRLDKATVITNPAFFVESHLNTIKGNNSRESKMPYFERLEKLYEILKNT